MTFGAHGLLLSVLIAAHVCVTSVHAAAACDDVKAFQCTEQALIISKATRCDYRVVIPYYTECVKTWTSGCNTLQQRTWDKRILRINATMHGATCSPECVNQLKIAAEVEWCRTVHTGLAAVAAQVLSTKPVHNHTICDYVLPRIRDCMVQKAAPCPIVAEAVTIELWQYSAAFNHCGQALPPPYIAKSPHDILRENGFTLIPSMNPLAIQHEKVALFAAIGVCLFVIVVAAAIAAYTMYMRNKKAKDEDNEPGKRDIQRVYVHDTIEQTVDMDEEVSQYGSVRGGVYQPRGRTWWDSYGGMDPSHYTDDTYEPDYDDMYT